MYRVLYWIGTLQPKCDLRLLSPDAANALKFEFEQRGYSARVVSGDYSCAASEQGLAPLSTRR